MVVVEADSMAAVDFMGPPHFTAVADFTPDSAAIVAEADGGEDTATAGKAATGAVAPAGEAVMVMAGAVGPADTGVIPIDGAGVSASDGPTGPGATPMHTTATALGGLPILATIRTIVFRAIPVRTTATIRLRQIPLQGLGVILENRGDHLRPEARLTRVKLPQAMHLPIPGRLCPWTG
jgi:hypothetical protein